MPLVRFEVRNEYGMGDPELYRLAVKREETKPVLDGVAVAGLVGILRQLGDMAEFAADIFHDLHEEVIATSARGRRVLTRVRNIEAALPSIEKAVKGQTSHIHLAYVPGIDFHAHVRTERSQLLSSDLPRFMMDSYEECRDPPRLYLLDKFDSGGSGVCLKRYSDPTFFHKAWDMLSKVQKAENAQREKKYNKIKRKGSQSRNNGAIQHSSTMSPIRNGSEILISSQRSSRFRSASVDLESISDNKSVPSRSTSFGSKSRFSQIDHVLNPNSNPNPDEISHISSSSPSSSSIRQDERNRESTIVPQLSWKEKVKSAMGPTRNIHCDDVIMDKVRNSDPGLNFIKSGNSIGGNLNLGLTLVSEESEIENFTDALNTLESETEMDTEFHTSEKTDFDSGSRMVVNSGVSVVNGEMHENYEIDHKEELSLNDSQRFSNGNNGLNENQSNLDAQSIESGNEISKTTPAELTNHFEPNENSSDLEDDSFVESSPRVRIKPKNASNLYELEFPQFSEIAPLVSPAHHQKNVEHTVINEPSKSSIIESINTDSEPKINAENNNNNAPYITDEQKTDITKDHFVNVPTKLWTNADLFGLEPSKPNVSVPNGISNHENGISNHENKTNQTLTSTHNNNSNNLSSSFSSLAQRFLTSSLQKGISQTPLSNSNTNNNNTSNPDLNFTKSNEPKIITKSSDGSSSPPLEFMKIFIHPSNSNINNTEDENSIFPDIQILQESEYQNGSDSDEDTFCKSYIYSSSDEELSPVIHSNSDMWDQEQIQRESFENIPSSTYIGFEQMDLPGIESVVFSSNQNGNNECFNNQESLVESELMPPPPPLPPAQWRVLNNNNSNPVNSSPESPVPLPPSFPTGLFQSKFSKKNEKSEKNGEEKSGNTGKEVSLEKEVLQWHNNKMEQQKLNGHEKPKKEVFEATKDLDEREDLLDQIRKKSFNLRRTMTSKPNSDLSQTATNSNVSAILEKANAIRQAFVGSDDGRDDDGWSDV